MSKSSNIIQNNSYKTEIVRTKIQKALTKSKIVYRKQKLFVQKNTLHKSKYF